MSEHPPGNWGHVGAGRPRERASSAAPMVCVLSANDSIRARLVEVLQSVFDVTVQQHGAQSRFIGGSPPSLVVLVEPPVDDVETWVGAELDLLLRSGSIPVVLVDPPGAFASSFRRSFAVSSHLSDDQLRSICMSAVRSRPKVDAAIDVRDAERLRLVLGKVRELSTLHQLPSVVSRLTGFVQEETGAQRCHLFFHDEETGQLWTTDADDKTREFQAGSGLVGYVACTGASVYSAIPERDPRYVAELDDPRGRGRDAIFATAVASSGVVHAVLLVVSRPNQDLLPAGRAYVEELAKQCGPLFEYFALEQHAAAVLQKGRERTFGVENVFRSQALETHFDTKDFKDIARVLPDWIAYVYPAALVLFVVVCIALVVVRVGVYSEGPALIRSANAIEVTAPSTGRLALVHVRPGQSVQRGDLLAEYDIEEEQANYDRAKGVWRSAVRSYMVELEDHERAELVADARQDLDATRSALRRRQVLAIRDGFVSEAHLRTGQSVSMGEPLLSIHPDGDTLDVVAVVPASDRPMIEANDILRFELEGHERVRVNLRIDSAGVDVLGPSELHRLLGPMSEGLAMNVPGVLVRAKLTRATFEEDDKLYRFRAGMRGNASVRIGSHSVLLTLFPALRKTRFFRDVELTVGS